MSRSTSSAVALVIAFGAAGCLSTEGHSGPTITAYVDDAMGVTTTDTMLPNGGIGLGISNGTD